MNTSCLWTCFSAPSQAMSSLQSCGLLCYIRVVMAARLRDGTGYYRSTTRHAHVQRQLSVANIIGRNKNKNKEGTAVAMANIAVSNKNSNKEGTNMATPNSVERNKNKNKEGTTPNIVVIRTVTKKVLL